VQRSELAPVVYDYRDHKIDYLNKLFLKRNTHYRKLQKQYLLNADVQPKEDTPRPPIRINETAYCNFSDLEFCYGTIGFTYQSNASETPIEFEIEHDYIRPEFELLKPYFAKQLGIKTVKTHLQAEIDNGTIISQSANSGDLMRIDQDIIDTVRFRFIAKMANWKHTGEVQDPFSESEKQSEIQSMFGSEDEMIEHLLAKSDSKHADHLRYLVRLHCADIIKIRFVLSPFSFVFLLAGQEQYHVVLETIDTEEATYLWHLPKSRTMLSENMKTVDKALMHIRNAGRQSFMETVPENFTRIFHDYSGTRKVFMLWKNSLEECLV